MVWYTSLMVYYCHPQPGKILIVHFFRGSRDPGSFQLSGMKKDLSITSRILVAFASGALIIVFFLPVWRIDLFAPQYPEGLTMNIWINGLSGDVDIINGLNHYIGMKHITVAMFPEFKYLSFVVMFFIILGMLVALSGKSKFLLAYLGLTAIGGILAMYDFYTWGYNYGHNLDPTAPIQVPGLFYQPPLLGHKRLLNFDAYSFPHIGGWVVIGAALLAFSVWLAEWYRHRPAKNNKNITGTVLAGLFAALLFSSCSTNPQPFEPGKDICDFCKMGITDTRFGGELITKKGKVMKFDDLHCLISYLHSNAVAEKDIDKKLAVNFAAPNTFLDVKTAVFVHSDVLKSPMGSNTAAFPDETTASAQATGQTGIHQNWEVLFRSIH